MNKLKLLELSQQYEVLTSEAKVLKLQQDLIKKKLKLEMGDMDEFSFEGAKVSVTRSDRKMYLKEKLIEKFGEDELVSCVKTIPNETIRISYKEVN